jgi:hypothetical protein
MNLDDRARHAADALHDATGPTTMDVPAAAGRVDAAATRRRRRTRTARVAASALAVAGLVTAAAVVTDLADGGSSEERIAVDDPTPKATTTTSVETTTTSILSERDRFALVPATPIDGRDSYRLPVQAIPDDGLADGQVVGVLGKGFEPHESVGIVQCASEALEELQQACDLSVLDYVETDAAGEVDATFVVRRFITTPNQGEVDCASTPGRCFVGIGAISNYDRSGSTSITFATTPS